MSAPVPAILSRNGTIAALSDRVAELEHERLAAGAEVARLGMLHAQAASECDALDCENRALAGEVRRLQYLTAEVDRWLAEGPAYDDTDPRTWDHQELRNRLAAARRYVQGQGPDGPGAVYPVRLDGWRPGMAPRGAPPPRPPELREAPPETAGGA